MRIIKVSATESTNMLAKDWQQSNAFNAPICFVANAQTSGRGQRGSRWISNPGQNLTMSLLIPSPTVSVRNQFILSAAVGLGVLEALKELKINKLNLKWPNDIMAANLKAGGILIENIIANGRISTSIIGLGLNINQVQFQGLPKATSLKLVSSKTFDIEEVMGIVLKHLEEKINNLSVKPPAVILADYEEVLFKKDVVSTFKLSSGKLISGIIKGITSSGLLKVLDDNEIVNHYDLKELQLLF